eukprot:gene11318-12503_t
MAMNMFKPAKQDKIKNGEKKRAAQSSPKEAPQKKRSAFGDITNAGNRKIPLAGKKSTKTSKSTVLQKAVVKQETKIPVKKGTSSSNKFSVNSKGNILPEYIFKKDEKISSVLENKKDSSLSSFETDSLNSNLSDDDIFKLSSDGLTSSQEALAANMNASADTVILSDVSTKEKSPDVENFNSPEVKRILPEGVRDVDTDKDPFSMCEYVEAIFRNMKACEHKFPVRKYLADRKDITPGMRAVLIDWLVEVQENFELYHETLYLAVRIIDLYLQQKECKREKLQLIGATAMFIACKIEERHAPPLDDFVFVCDDAYQSNQFVAIEIDILATLNFELGLPISYRFLRRYSRVAGSSMETLTLARYILESSLLHYEFVDCRQSQIAAAALNLAFRMKNAGTWDKTLVYHSGYTEEQLKDLVLRLNKMLHSPAKKNLSTVQTKYSHPVFSEVAKIPLIEITE